MRLRRLLFGLCLCVLLAGFTSCSSKESEKPGESPNATAAGPMYAVTGSEGSISGAVAFNSPPPAPKKIQMDSDPVCAQKAKDGTAEEIIVKDGKLANVFVFVKSGLPRNSFATPTQEVVLDQLGCRYVPHVVGIQTNQNLKVLNSDATSHNVHPVPTKNREWNESQYPSSPPIVKKFAIEEVLIPIKCNQHSWMKAYVGVLSHPFYAVTGMDGAFVIKGLPPGQYELEAWHEKLGTKTINLTVAQRTEAKAEFRFEAQTASRPSSLKIQPALVLP